MRRVLAILVLASAACGPKVHPQATFDQDDPRADHRAAEGPGDDPSVAIVDGPAPVGTRTGSLSRLEVDALLDAGPAELLRAIEVTALRPDGKFTGWQLVRFVVAPGAPHRFGGVDLAIGDVLGSVNGHTLETPPDLSALWLELYRASAIDVRLDRSGRPIALHFDITP